VPAKRRERKKNQDSSRVELRADKISLGKRTAEEKRVVRIRVVRIELVQERRSRYGR
jgi:hypothetical protein